VAAENPVDEDDGQQGPGKGEPRGPWNPQQRERQTEMDVGRSAERRPAGYSEREGFGQRITEDGLERQSARGQSRAGQKRHDDAGHAKLPENSHRGLIALLPQRRKRDPLHAGKRRAGQHQRGDQGDQEEYPEASHG
jgi:hypothetical protein